MNENDTRTPPKKANKKGQQESKKRPKKKAKEYLKNLNWTDIINMSESVTLWILRKFNWWINWLNERMNVCLNEWMNEWVAWVPGRVQGNAGKRIWISKSKTKTKWSKPNQWPIGNLQSHPHPYDIIITIIKAATETKQNPELNSTAQSSTQQFSSQIEVKSVKNTNRHAQN